MNVLACLEERHVMKVCDLPMVDTFKIDPPSQTCIMENAFPTPTKGKKMQHVDFTTKKSNLYMQMKLRAI